MRQRLAADDLEPRSTSMPSNRPGLFFMGTHPLGVPFGDGRRCVGGSVFRFAVSNSGADGVLGLGPGTDWL